MFLFSELHFFNHILKRCCEGIVVRFLFSLGYMFLTLYEKVLRVYLSDGLIWGLGPVILSAVDLIDLDLVRL